MARTAPADRAIAFGLWAMSKRSSRSASGAHSDLRVISKKSAPSNKRGLK